MLRFGDHLSNALHEIKQKTGKKIRILMDELGYGFDPELSGDAIESWRYRKGPPTLAHLETLARLLLNYGADEHNRAWLKTFLESGNHPYPQAICDSYFPDESAPPPPTTSNKNTSSPPPIKAYRPPEVAGFVGRQEEIVHYRSLLEQHAFAVISGMAGVGKTSLMSMLAREHLEPRFWHTFSSGTLDSLVNRLAGFIAHLGRPEIWELLESARVSNSRPTALDTLLDMLSVVLGEVKERPLLCFDDLQFVDEDPRLRQFMQAILAHKNLDILVTSRRYPSFFPSGHERPLDGLTVQETATLLHQRETTLNEDLIVQLNRATGGNSAFLTLAAVILKDSRYPETIISQLAQEANVERFLMEEVNDRLSKNEQRVMEAIAILSGYPGSRELLEEILNMRNVVRALRDLSDQYLLLVGESDDGERVYSQHQIIQAFFYDQPRRSQLREMHARAAEYYEAEQPDRFLAILHYAKAQDTARVAQLAYDHADTVLNQGHGKALQQVLVHIDSNKIDGPAELQLSFLIARGRLQTLLGDLKDSEADLRQAAKMLEEMSKTAEADPFGSAGGRLKAEVCLAMGQLFERQDPPEALKWLQLGNQLNNHKDVGLTAELKINEGMIHCHMGNFGEALETLHDGLESNPDINQSTLTEALNTLGAVNGHLGNLEKAKSYSLQALEISQAMGDRLQTSRIFTNLGWVNYILGERNAAVDALEAGTKIAQEIGSLDTEMSLQINLGGCYVEMGNVDKARQHLSRGEEIARLYQSQQLITALIRLGELNLNDKQFQTSLGFLREAEHLATRLNDQASLATIYGLQASSFSFLDNLKQAQVLAEKAIHQDKILGDEWSLGLNLRIRGEIAALQNDLNSAEAFLEQSAQFLKKSEDSFQEAITHLRHGELLIQNGSKQKGLKLIQDAISEFEKFQDSPEYKRAIAWK